MAFNPKKCAFGSVYCGTQISIPESKIFNTYYTRRGTPNECLRKGIGIALYEQNLKTLPKNSLQRIKYIGVKYNNNFKNKNIKTTISLLKFAKSNSVANIEKLLKSVLKKSNSNVIDRRAYNSVLMYLYMNGYTKIPQCKKI